MNGFRSVSEYLWANLVPMFKNQIAWRVMSDSNMRTNGLSVFGPPGGQIAGSREPKRSAAFAGIDPVSGH
jgi:hypothetical protein